MPIRRKIATTLPESDPAHRPSETANRLEIALGRQLKAFRREADLTVAELGRLAGLSAGMLSKIENGSTSPSLATIQALSRALNVPVTAFFRKFEEQRDASFVPAGQGVTTERRGTRAGHQYQLLGHILSKALSVEPYLITLTEASDVFPIFQHDGVEFLHMIQGAVDYRHGDKVYKLRPGDSLLFDAAAPHGPEVLRRLPARYLSIIVNAPDRE